MMMESSNTARQNQARFRSSLRLIPKNLADGTSVDSGLGNPVQTCLPMTGMVQQGVESTVCCMKMAKASVLTAR